MTKYCVEINGRNLLVDMGGHIAKHGFFTMRFVEAPDRVAAENSAVNMIRGAESLRDLVRNVPTDPPIMDVTSIEELASFEGIDNLEPGLVWYPEVPKRWWQFWKLS